MTFSITQIFSKRDEWASKVVLVVKKPAAKAKTYEMWVRSLGQENSHPLEGEMATHSSILAGRIPWTKKSGRDSPLGHTEPDTTEATERTYISSHE